MRLATLRWLGVLLCALAMMLGSASNASALEPTQTKTCVWGFDFAEHNSDGLLSAATHGKHQGNRAALSEIASGSLLVAEGAESFTTLYRTVGEGERAAIEATSSYEPALGGVEGKYFYPTAEQATGLARANFSSQGVQTLTSVQVPNSVLGGATRLSVGAEGRVLFFTGEQLPALGTPQVWNYFPVGGP
jgi:hypothetical protein